MLPEARDRQKFVSDVQYLRDMQHKVESEYQACLRRQEYRRDPNEKKRDQPWGQETNFERPRFSSGLSSKQSSSEEDLLAEPKLSTKNSVVKCDSRLPAIDQTSVKQKHKSTMTKRKPEKGSPSKLSPENSPLLPGHAHSFSGLHQLALSQNQHHHQLPSSTAQASQILSRKRRPNLGRLTVSPDLESPRASSPDVQSPRASGDRSRQKLQLPVRAPALRGADAVVQQESPMWARDTKLKRPTLERRNLVPSSQLMTMTKNTPERARKVDPSGFSQNEPRPALSQAFQRTNSPQVMSKSVGSPLATTTTVEGSKRVPFRFRDEDFYSILSLNPEGENDDTEEETHIEEELLLAGMHPPRSPSNHRRSRFLGTSAAQAKNKNFEDNPEKCRADSLRSECSHGSLKSNAMEPGTKPPSVGQRMFQDHRLPDGGSAKEDDSSDNENEEKTFCSWDTKTEPIVDDDLDSENVFSDCTSMDDKPGTHDYERDWQTYLNSSSTSLDYFLSGRPTAAPRASMNSSYNTPESLVHSDPRDDIPVDLSMASTLVHSSDLDGNSRFNVRRPLSPIRNRNPFASAEHHSYLPVNSAQEFDVRRAEAITLRSQSQGDPFRTEDVLLNPQSSVSVVESPSSSPSRTNLQGHLHVPGSLPQNVPFTFLAVSEFPYRNGSGNRMAISGFTDEKETTKIKADPEKLKKLQESLLEEDSEEEGDMCRICQIAGGSPTNPLLEPCGCVGSLQFVHQECLKKWLKVKITSGADLGAVKTCEMCKQGLLVDLDDFNMTEFYRKHQQSRAQNELMNSGLYLVLLLHLYEQRFAELMRINYNRAVREREVSLESRFGESDSTDLCRERYSRRRNTQVQDSELGDGNESSIYQSNSRVI